MSVARGGLPPVLPPDAAEPLEVRELQAFLRVVRRRWFVQVALRTLARAAALAGAAGLAALGAYWFVRPGDQALVLLALVGVLAAAAAAVMVLRHMPPRPTDRQVARFVEERVARIPDVSGFDDTLVSAVDDSAPRPPAVRRLLAASAVGRLHDISPEQIVPAPGIRRAAAEASAGASVLLLALLAAGGPLGRAFEAARLLLFPATVQVDVLPGDTRVVAGQTLTIRAAVRAGDGRVAGVTPSLVVTAGAEQRMVGMTPEGDGYAYTFESVDRTFTYRVTAGAASSSQHTVTALFPPRIQRIDVRYEYPGFTGLAPREDEDGGDIYGPAGTKVRVRVHADKPAASGALSFDAGRASPLRVTATGGLETDFVLARDDSYRVTLEDLDGLTSRGDTEYFIRVMDDRPPDVRVLRPSGDQQITPLEEVVIEARADDDHGIARLDLVYSVAGREPRSVPFSRTAGSDGTRLGTHVLFAEDLRVQPGDVITYYARAVDVGRGKRPTESRSDMYFLEVRPFNEEFVAAQSQAGGGMAGGQQLEGLIAAQKEIIGATWNVERRSGAGRSSDDIKAIAQAQTELRTRAEQMLSRGVRGRSPFPFPQQLPVRPGRGAPAGGDRIRAAVQAMARAAEQLQDERTKEALPHQMAALQALLQAQAEVRRREVMQQQAGAGTGGSGRQGQDLSALFDKELQRQQRTNYETRSQIDERPDRSERDSTLDRIRDLARRQEDLSRRQRELAQAELSADERKRQLERLMREQLELSERLEQLARQSGQQQSSQGGSQGQRGRSGQASATQSGQQGQEKGTGRDGASSMRQVAEQMQHAAGDLAREDPGAAAERAGRAAADLRTLEQQMRGNSADARARAAGELRLEAQQIAEEQRRIAAEVERLERGDASATADARRRLAGEKDRLADRVDGLKRGAGELGKAQQGAGQGERDQARATEAARDLDRMRLGERMRETAAELRSAGASTAPAEREIARGLDRVVEQLGGSGAGSLSNALDETRHIRERLDRLERQLREAEAGGRQGRSGGAGRQGRADQPSQGASPGGRAEQLQTLREEYNRELQQARESLGRMEQSAPRAGVGGSTPEREERSQAAPGHEAFKQDFAGWESLRKDVDLALERQEAAVSARLAEQRAQDRLSAGGSERVPDSYRALIARYFEALARVKK